MLRRHHVFFYSFLAVLLAVALGYGISQHVRYRQAARLLEETYQSALADAAQHLNGLNVSLEKLLLTQDAGPSAVLLSRISQQAGEAQSSLAVLPLSHQATGQAIRFLAQAEEYARLLAGEAARGQARSQQEAEQLERMATQAALLWGQLEVSRDQMEQIGAGMLAGQENPFYRDAQGDIRPLEQLAAENMEYPTLIYDGAFSDGRQSGQPAGLPANEITHEEALAIARTFIGEERVLSIKEAPDTLGDIPAWGVQVETADGVLNVEVTRQGGKVLWMMPEHGGFEPALTLEECKAKAAGFLTSRGFGAMEASYYQVYEGLATIQFVAVQEGVILYPDQVKVQCRLDTGEVVGLEAHNYWMNHRDRANLAPGLSQEEASAKVSPRLTVTNQRLCLIPQTTGERLCYEFAGTWEDGEYRLYLDAHTGEQTELLKIIPSADGVLTV